MRVSTLVLALAISVNAESSAETNGDYCKGNCTTDDSGDKQCTFTTELNLYASELGYYSFKECGAKTNPTLELEVGTTYTFDQTNVTNWYHPLGFAYYPDGAHDEVDELEPGIAAPGSNSDCEISFTCPAPMYMLNGIYLGDYSNNALITESTTMDKEDFGLDHYEPKFFLPITDWTEEGEFSVKLKIDESVTKDIFYFCHIHQFMSGRIKIAKNGQIVNPEYDPPLPYKYETPSDYDKSCGTYNIESFQLPHDMCPEKFVCDVPTGDDQASKDLQSFSDCIESMDCAMVVGMTNGVSAESEVALFIHQMIPHHQNAVNMAKALLKRGTGVCDDITAETEACVMKSIILSIINGQNHQIQQMRSVLEGLEYPQDDQCVV